MEVLVLGLPRTVTQCWYAASTDICTPAYRHAAIADGLALLGYGPIYHMREVGKNKHQQQWVAALEAKFEGKGKPFGREEFDALLGGCSVNYRTACLRRKFRADRDRECPTTPPQFSQKSSFRALHPRRRWMVQVDDGHAMALLEGVCPRCESHALAQRQAS